jgi:Na+/H+ antiporter NhaD/arsenite permease-like protein
MTVIKNGLVGSLGIQPYSILILFYSLAYICVSLDMTGIFQFLAFWVSKRAGSRGRLAFTLFFVLTSLMSGLTSNDVVILTGTAFLAYFTRVSGILPTAFMMSEFTSANIGKV